MWHLAPFPPVSFILCVTFPLLFSAVGPSAKSAATAGSDSFSHMPSSTLGVSTTHAETPHSWLRIQGSLQTSCHLAFHLPLHELWDPRRLACSLLRPGWPCSVWVGALYSGIPTGDVLSLFLPAGSSPLRPLSFPGLSLLSPRHPRAWSAPSGHVVSNLFTCLCVLCRGRMSC